MKNVTKIDDTHYKVKMSSEEITGLMTETDIDTSSITGSIEADVYVKDKYIVKIEYDFANLISGFENFKTTISFSNYDTAGDVTIPGSIINGAIEY